MLSAAARPRWIVALMPDSDFNRSSNAISATVYDRNVAISSPPVSLCFNAIQMMKPTAPAASNTVNGELAALVRDCFDMAVRSEFAARTARSRS